MTTTWPLPKASNGTRLGLIPEEIYVKLVGRPVAKSISQIITDQQRETTRYKYPDGQRDPTQAWTMIERAEYIDSLCKNMCADQNWLLNQVTSGNDRGYWILDAGHRFETVRMFIADELRDLEGNLFSEYTEDQRQYFLDLSITVCVYRDLTGEQQELLFTRRNKGAILKGGEWLNSKLMSKDHVFINRLHAEGLLKNFTESLSLVQQYIRDTRFNHTLLLFHLASNYLLTRDFVDRKFKRSIKEIISMKKQPIPLAKENNKIEQVVSTLTSGQFTRFIGNLKIHLKVLFKLWNQHRTEKTALIMQKDLFHAQAFLIGGVFEQFGGQFADDIYGFFRDIQDANSPWCGKWKEQHRNAHGNTPDEVVHERKYAVLNEYMQKLKRGTKRPRKQSEPTRCMGASSSLPDRVISALIPGRAR